MKKLLGLLALLFFLPAQAVRAEGGTAVQVDPEYAAEYEQAVSALMVHTPGAVVDYALRERDDGRYEWDLFFTLDGQLGECEVAEADFKVRAVTLRDMPDKALLPSEAMELLVREKGAVRIVDLELDRDRGRLAYEGEAELDGKRYEFEIDAAGDRIKWERD